MTHYDTLGVSPSASDTEIKKAYRKLALKLHPDKVGKATTTTSTTATATDPGEEFKKVTEAYSVLSDSAKKDVYDRSLRHKIGGSGGASGNGTGRSGWDGWAYNSFNRYSNGGNTFGGTFSGSFGNTFSGETYRDHYDHIKRQHEEARRRQKEQSRFADESKQREDKARKEREAFENKQRQEAEIKRRMEERARWEKEVRARESELVKRRQREIEEEARRRLANLNVAVNEQKVDEKVKTKENVVTSENTASSSPPAPKLPSPPSPPPQSEKDRFGFKTTDTSFDDVFAENESTDTNKETPVFRFEPEEISAGGYKYDPDESSKMTWDDAIGFQPDDQNINTDGIVDDLENENENENENEDVIGNENENEPEEPIEIEVINSEESSDDESDESSGIDSDLGSDIDMNNDFGGTKEDPIVIDLDDTVDEDSLKDNNEYDETNGSLYEDENDNLGKSPSHSHTQKKPKLNNYQFQNNDDVSHEAFFENLRKSSTSPDKRKASYNKQGQYKTDKRNHKKFKISPSEKENVDAEPTKTPNLLHPIIQQEQNLFEIVCSQSFGYSGLSLIETFERKRLWEDMFYQYETCYQEAAKYALNINSGDSHLMLRTLLGHSAVIAGRRSEFAAITLENI